MGTPVTVHRLLAFCSHWAESGDPTATLTPRVSAGAGALPCALTMTGDRGVKPQPAESTR